MNSIIKLIVVAYGVIIKFTIHAHNRDKIYIESEIDKIRYKQFFIHYILYQLQ